MKQRFIAALSLVAGGGLVAVALTGIPAHAVTGFLDQSDATHPWDQQVRTHTRDLMDQGREAFRYDTFGSEAFFSVGLGLHQAIEGSKFPGGVGDGVSPKTALSVGLKGVGITCAFCHSTVDNSFAPGIGKRLDGWANQDLNVGAIVALSPNLQGVADLLNKAGGPQVDVPTVQKVLMSWGPGRFDAELFMDGKAFGPGGSNASTLIPDAFGLAGVNAHTWTGNWGTVTYWNAFVSNLEMHGAPGTFFDPRLDDKNRFPVAAANNFGHVSTPPGEDRISPRLGPLQFYQLSLPTPKPKAGTDFDQGGSDRGRVLFNGRAQCATCHVPPMFSEPGWNLHTPGEIGLDDESGKFEAERSPDGKYRTTPLAGRLFKRTRGFFHDGRFTTLMDVVNHFDSFQKLGLSDNEKSDLVEYLKSI